jgi:hypothetical protein
MQEPKKPTFMDFWELDGSREDKKEFYTRQYKIHDLNVCPDCEKPLENVTFVAFKITRHAFLTPIGPLYDDEASCEWATTETKKKFEYKRCTECEWVNKIFDEDVITDEKIPRNIKGEEDEENAS